MLRGPAAAALIVSLSLAAGGGARALAAGSPASQLPADARPADPELGALLARAAEYLADYAKALSSVVAEEEYVQRHNRPISNQSVPGGNLGAASNYSIRERRLKSDFLLVRTSEASSWIPFRDVFEVDGKAVRDREDRLRKLFLETPATAMDQARQIMLEGARYNLGNVARTINIPTLPLMLVDPLQRDRFSWRRHGEQTIEDTRTHRVDYEELRRPTLVRTSGGGDVPLSGTLWIDPVTGRLIKGLVQAGHQKGTWMEMAVTFRPNDALGVWVPAEMKEYYQYPGQTLDATARYFGFRRFQVKTEETIRFPK